MTVFRQTTALKIKNSAPSVILAGNAYAEGSGKNMHSCLEKMLIHEYVQYECLTFTFYYAIVVTCNVCRCDNVWESDKPPNSQIFLKSDFLPPPLPPTLPAGGTRIKIAAVINLPCL